MPDSYTPVDTFHPTITVPIDADTPNASSVTTPLEQLADNIVFTQSGWIPTSGGSLTGVLALESGGFIEDENSNTVPGLVCLVQAASGHKKLLIEWELGPDVGGHVIFGRVYSSGNGSTSQIETTVNAAWNDSAGTWGQDDTAIPATRLIETNAGASLQGYVGSTGWADTAWVARTSSGTFGTNATGFFADGNGGGFGLLATGGATGAGAVLNGGATSGSGSISQANGGNSYGSEHYGLGTGSGVYAEGGATGPGVAGLGGGSEPGLAGTGGATGAGVAATGGSSSGNGGLFTGTGGAAGVYGVSDTGPGVEGVANSVGPGVLGQTIQAGSPGVAAGSNAGAAALYATCANATPSLASGAALAGDTSGGSGNAGYFNGNATKGTIHLVPLPWNGSLATSLPTAGSLGELCMLTNSGGQVALWIYTGATGGSGYGNWNPLEVVP